jgi:hypothetical protein
MLIPPVAHLLIGWSRQSTVGRRWGRVSCSDGAGSVVKRHQLERGIFDLCGVALLIVWHAENDVGELCACGLDRQRVIAKDSRDAPPSVVERLENDLQRLRPVRGNADEFPCFHR